MQHPIGYYSSSPYAQRLEGRYGCHLQDCPITRIPDIIREILDQWAVGDPENIGLLPFLGVVLIDRTTPSTPLDAAIEN